MPDQQRRDRRQRVIDVLMDRNLVEVEQVADAILALDDDPAEIEDARRVLAAELRRRALANIERTA